MRSSVNSISATPRRMLSTSPPGSTTTPRMVLGDHNSAQFCWKGVTGRIAARSGKVGSLIAKRPDRPPPSPRPRPDRLGRPDPRSAGGQPRRRGVGGNDEGLAHQRVALGRIKGIVLPGALLPHLIENAGRHGLGCLTAPGTDGAHRLFNIGGARDPDVAMVSLMGPHEALERLP